MKNSYKIIKSVIISEKATALKDQNKYIFRVAEDSNKIEIKNAVEKLYDVKVKSVNIINQKGKVKRSGRMLKAGKRADTRKALITLKSGEINFL
ncbi:MAG TPA: 50S ribosomal protein L23 [Victivallales bacterium]|nr:50S ribosomal protein L23 [Victivallales bacterium]